MDPYFVQILQWVWILDHFLAGDIIEEIGEKLLPITEQRFRMKKCGKELYVLWEKEWPDWARGKIKIKDIIYEEECRPYATTQGVHPGRHFLPNGQMRQKFSLCVYKIDNILRYNSKGGPDSTKMYVGGHELVAPCVPGFRLARGCARCGERGIIRDQSDPIWKILKELNFTKREIWEFELGKKESIIKHKKRIYNYLLSLE